MASPLTPILLYLYLSFLCLQGLVSGSAELREQAAIGLGELIDVTSEQALKAFVIPITGYVIVMISVYNFMIFFT